MSDLARPHFGHPKGFIQLDFVGNCVLAAGNVVPPDGSTGFASGALFFKNDGGPGLALYKNDGTDTASSFKPVPAESPGPAARVAAGVANVTGTGDIVTGLTTVTSVQATLQADAALANGTLVTATIGDQAGAPAAGSVTIKVWKPTSAADGTPIASAAAVAVNWLAIGT